jgi:hypothetical protein
MGWAAILSLQSIIQTEKAGIEQTKDKKSGTVARPPITPVMAGVAWALMVGYHRDGGRCMDVDGGISLGLR